ncbi:MAG TPA: mechanosensitive ion channel domain-containing protein [Nitratidesulfovibrio sp.]|nr:mechanosensitive ion channel domain-containing protein [Nitratidesulfovibrio sp.]
MLHAPIRLAFRSPRRLTMLLALLGMALLAGLNPARSGLLAPPAALAATADSAPALPGNAPQDAPDGQQAMDVIWQTRGQELSALVEEADQLRKSLPDMAKALDTQVAAVQRDYQRLFALYQLSRNHPSEMAAIRRQLAGVQRTLQGRLAPMEATDASVRQRLDDFTALDKELSEHLATERSSELSKDLAEYLAKLTEGRKNLTALRTRLARALDPGHAVNAKLTQALEQIDAQLPALWRTYYLVASSSLMDLTVWQSLPTNLAAWSDTVEVRLATEFPQTSRDWGALLLRFAFLAVPLLLLGRLTLRRGCRLPGGWAESCRNVAARSWPWIAIGIALHFASWARGGEVYRAVVVPAHLLLLWGELTLVWSLRGTGLAGVPLRSPLSLLFAPAAIGVLLLFLNPPAVLLAPVWALCMVAVLAVRARRGRPHVLPLLEKVLLACEPALCIISLLAAVFGWARLAIPFFLVALAVAVALQLGAVLVAFVTLLAERLPETGMRALLRGLVLGLGAPAMWVVAAATLLPWMSAFPGGPYMMRQALELNVNVGSVSFNSLRVLGLVLLFYLTRSAIAVGTSFLENLPARLPRVERGVIPPLQTGLTYALWALFGLVVLNAIGVSLTSLTVIAGGLSVGLGFGLQTIFNNFFSGLILIFGRSLQEGDIIQIGETWGTVRKISIRSTTVETFDNAVIFVPNSEFVSNRLTNWTRNSLRMRRDIAVGVAYGSDIDKVTDLLKLAAADHPHVMRDPAPNVLFQEFGPSSLDFVLRVWVDDLNYGASTASDLRRVIDRLFRENDIEISFPQMDVHVRAIDGLPALSPAPAPVAPATSASGSGEGAAQRGDSPATPGAPGRSDTANRAGGHDAPRNRGEGFGPGEADADERPGD